MRRRTLKAVLCTALVVSASATVLAQPAGGQAEIDARASAREAERRQRSERLRETDRRALESGEAVRRLASEIERLRVDRAGLSASLVDAANRSRDTEGRIREIEAGLELSETSETAIRNSLESRKGTAAEVLAALQRLGRSAAPAMLVHPEDVLGAVRSAILLGAVVPSLREEVDALSSDLAELSRLREIGEVDRRRLAAELGVLRLDGERVDALLRVRQEQLAAAEATFGAERSRASALALEARSLRELVARLDAELGAARREAEAETRQVRERFAAAAGRDPVRLAPKTPFAEARGTLPRPVAGPVSKDYGAPDGQGGTVRGVVIAARAKGLVTAPADGWISFAGQFRSYGRLLIIHAGDGYYLLLAGMDRISVEAGQFVLAGEPVGQMGEMASLSAALSVVEGSGPSLYVEFRKDGGPIDPRPWWARSQTEKVRG